MIGILGSVEFKCSSESVKTFSDLSVSNSPRYGRHDSLQGKPLMEFIGPGLDKISLKLTWSIEGGINPMNEIKPLIKARDEGEILTFLLGSKLVGSGKYAVTSVSTAHNRIDNKGNTLSASFNVSLEEYIVDKPDKKKVEETKTITKKNVQKKLLIAPAIVAAPSINRDKLGAR